MMKKPKLKHIKDIEKSIIYVIYLNNNSKKTNFFINPRLKESLKSGFLTVSKYIKTNCFYLEIPESLCFDIT